MMVDEKSVREKLCKEHDGDIQQLNVIFSENKRIIVEAPAGYGKTTTMVSRIAYLYAMGKIPNPKKMLGLTFSVNAALKVKRDVSSKLPIILGGKDNPIEIGESIHVTNYHGFCKGIIKKYGYLLNPLLKKDPNLFKAIGDYEISKDFEIQKILLADEKKYLLQVEENVKKSIPPTMDEIIKYNNIMFEKLLVNNIITHTGIILVTLQLLDKYKTIQSFYSSYYPLIVVDEFQDTNCISWELLKKIITEKTQLLFLGDSLQRIYGFIGAIPGIMDIAREQFQMEQIQLTQNYRFMNNKEMLKLDHNIRSNAKVLFANQDLDVADVQTILKKTHEAEADEIVSLIRALQEKSFESKVAVLFRGRGKNVQILQTVLENAGINYFYGMFKDDDEEYVQFHLKCQTLFISKFGSKKNISNKALQNFVNEIENEFIDSPSQIMQSLIVLLNAMIVKIKIDYSDLQPEDRYELILDTFENRQLKQAMEYIDADVILSTVHGSKGLEWSYVVIADIEQWLFPGYPVCSLCPNKYLKDVNYCSLPVVSSGTELASEFLDELSVFYVAVTRARKQIYLSASLTRYNSNDELKNSRLSCLAKQPGIRLVKLSIDNLVY